MISSILNFSVSSSISFPSSGHSSFVSPLVLGKTAKGVMTDPQQINILSFNCSVLLSLLSLGRMVVLIFMIVRASGGN